MMASNERTKALILEVVDNQLRDNTPPETRQTYQRLFKQGYSQDEARELIGAVVSREIFEVLKKQEVYDQKRFIVALHKLPQIPSDPMGDVR